MPTETTSQMQKAASILAAGLHELDTLPLDEAVRRAYVAGGISTIELKLRIAARRRAT